jgi:tetratricopeptide (TPR) repeat protein
MKQDLEYTIYIERYLRGEMTPEELRWFKKELDGNTALSNEIELHRKVDAVLSNGEMIELKKQLDQMHKEIEKVAESGKGAIRKMYQRVYYAASALAVGIILFTLFFANRNFSNNKLLEEYYQPDMASITYRSGDKSDMLLQDAMTLYTQKDYASAIVLFEKILSKDQSKVGVNLYSGIANLEVSNYNKANQNFQTIIDQKPNPFVESATWYLGMCYIMTNNREKAEEQFEILSKSDGYYKKDARKILRRIK